MESLKQIWALLADPNVIWLFVPIALGLIIGRLFR